jgi:hypothetical protein
MLLTHFNEEELPDKGKPGEAIKTRMEGLSTLVSQMTIGIKEQAVWAQFAQEQDDIFKAMDKSNGEKFKSILDKFSADLQGLSDEGSVVIKDFQSEMKSFIKGY